MIPHPRSRLPWTVARSLLLAALGGAAPGAVSAEPATAEQTETSTAPEGATERGVADEDPFEIGDVDELGTQPEAPTGPREQRPRPTSRPPRPEPTARADRPSQDDTTPAGRTASPERRCLEPCAQLGECVLTNVGCVPGSAADCQASRGCAYEGRCTPAIDRCVATSELDCLRSIACAEQGACALDGDENRCVEKDEGELASPGLLAVGVLTTVLGGAAFVAGPGVMMFGHDDTALGVGILVGGLAGLGAGIPMIAVGGRRTEQSPETAAALRFGLGPTGVGFGGTF